MRVWTRARSGSLQVIEVGAAHARRALYAVTLEQPVYQQIFQVEERRGTPGGGLTMTKQRLCAVLTSRAESMTPNAPRWQST